MRSTGEVKLRATDLELTTVADMQRLVSSDGVGVAIEELTALSDPFEVAFVVAKLMAVVGIREKRAFMSELRDAVNDRDAHRA